MNRFRQRRRSFFDRPPQAHVTISLDTDFLDHSASEMIADWARVHTVNGGTVVIEETGKGLLKV